jgi:hypothetical protein
VKTEYLNGCNENRDRRRAFGAWRRRLRPDASDPALAVNCQRPVSRRLPGAASQVDETDELRLWEKNIGGVMFKGRNEFLQHRVLIDFTLTEQALADIVERFRSSSRG